MSTHLISSEHLSIAKIQKIISSDAEIILSDDSVAKINKCRAYLDEKIQEKGTKYYGINTGFGSLCNTPIDEKDLKLLQLNLVRSHACGLGDEVPTEIVKLMLLLKAQGLSYGHSGVALTTVQRLLDFYNNDITPVVFQQGSLGASGDLAPLAHLALALIGEGNVRVDGALMSSEELHKKMNWQPLELISKEGLALLNGTQFMSAYGVWCVIQANQLLKAGTEVAAMSIEAFHCRTNPYFANVNEIRNQKGQIKIAAQIRNLLDGSEIAAAEKQQVQDPYSFRCIPQVHGASVDVIEYATEILEREINAVTDNPTIFPETDEIISAGNFHGQPLALTLDQLGIALAELTNISERRIYKLISGERELPAFLTPSPGLNSGLMIVQYAAASIVSQNKQLATPASVDSIESSNGQEDHVSMGANAATKLFTITQNLKKVIGLELLNAAQALEFRRPMKSSEKIEKIFSAYRAEVPFIEEDVFMHPQMEKSINFIENL